MYQTQIPPFNSSQPRAQGSRSSFCYTCNLLSLAYIEAEFWSLSNTWHNFFQTTTSPHLAVHPPRKRCLEKALSSSSCSLGVPVQPLCVHWQLWELGLSRICRWCPVPAVCQGLSRGARMDLALGQAVFGLP